jgi:hypothetical protein
MTLSLEVATDGNCVLINHDTQQEVFAGSEEECRDARSEYFQGMRPEFDMVKVLEHKEN